MKRAALFLLLLTLTGCRNNVPDMAFEWPPITVLGADEIKAASGVTRSSSASTEGNAEELAALEEPIPYTVLYESEKVTSAVYEPMDGCYLAAQLDTYDEPDNELTAFNKHTGKKHAAFIYEMKLGDAFPETWLLSCIAAQATPMVILHPAGKNAAFSTGELTELAAAFGSYNIAVFMVFFPLTETHSFDAATYGLYYRYARALFYENAPKVAFVWAADAGLANTDAWYPGAEAVDWVGMTVTENLTEEGYADLTEYFDAFYMRYQMDKPVMLTQLAVSHFSTRDYVYRTQEAAEELERWYSDVRDTYPRVKLIGYMNVDETTINSPHFQDNYNVLLDDGLKKAYKNMIDDKHFISSLETDSGLYANTRATWLRSAYPGYYIEGQVQLDTNTVINELHSGFFTTVDHERQLIHVFLH